MEPLSYLNVLKEFLAPNCIQRMPRFSQRVVQNQGFCLFFVLGGVGS
jgi:hypothetical protein